MFQAQSVLGGQSFEGTAEAISLMNSVLRTEHNSRIGVVHPLPQSGKRQMELPGCVANAQI
jgi:hypothetical protein